METRSLAIGLVAIVAAFAAAFGVAKSGGSKAENAGAGVKAQSINVVAPAPVAGVEVEVGGTLPALKAEPKAPAKKKKKSTASAPSTNNSTTPAPESGNTAPSTPAPSTPAPSRPAPSQPAPSKPAPSQPAPEEPAQGGGETG
jgi:hypothetical protein